MKFNEINDVIITDTVRYGNKEIKVINILDKNILSPTDSHQVTHNFVRTYVG